MLHSLIARFDDSELPEIKPDFSAPFFDGIIMVASWILAVGLVLSFVALILAIIFLAWKGLGGDKMRALAGIALPWAIVGVIGLSAATGIFEWLIGLDFGFGKVFDGE
ncbi:MAG: hypothetical protein ACTHU7_00960 [Microbacterium sp.]